MPMTNSAAVRTSDSASTRCPPPSKDDRTRDGNEEEHARELECQQIVLEQWLGDHAHCVQLLQLLLVEVPRHDQLLWKPRPGDYHHFAQKSKADKSSHELPPSAASISKL